MPNEKLVVTMEGKDNLSPALKKVGDQAKQTGDEIQKLTSKDLSNIGAGMLRAAGSLATGLFDLAKASSNLAEAQNFTNAIFKEAAPAVNAFAKGAATSLGLSERAALDAAASVGIFGQRINLTGDDLAKFSTDLVTLAADMASIKNTKPEEAVTAIAAAMRNEYEPIRRYGVVLNDVVLKARALAMGIYDGTGQLTQQQKIIAVNAELYDQLGFAIGDFSRTQGELANQQRIMNAQWENLQASLGDALRPAFITVTGAANTFLDVLQKVPDPVKNIAANFVLAGTAVLGLGGAAIFTVGKVGELVGSFKEAKAKFDAWASSAGKTGQLVTTVGKVAAGVGIAAVATGTLISAFNEATGVSQTTAEALEGINVAIAKMDTKGAVASFKELVDVEQEQGRFSGLWEDFGREFNVAAVGVHGDIENIDRAFEKLTTDQQAVFIRQWKEILPTLASGSGEFNDLSDMIARYEPRVASAVQSQQALGDAGQFSAETLSEFGDAELANEEATKKMEEGHKKAAETMAAYARAVEEAERATDSAAETASEFADALEEATGTPQFLDNVVNIKDSLFELSEAWKDEEGALIDGAAALDINTEAGRSNIKAVDDLAASIRDELNRVYVESNGDIAKVNESAQAWNQTLYDQVLAITGSEEAAQAYVDTLNLTPETIETAIKLKDQDVAMKKLDLLGIEMDKIPPNIATAITAKMDEGDFISAYQIAKDWIGGKTPLEILAALEEESAMAAGTEAVETAQAAADGTPVVVPAEAGEVTGVAGVIGAAQGAVNATPITSEIEVLPGDVQTPQSQNVAYAKSNKPVTTIETKEGDYRIVWASIDGYMRTHDPQTTIETLPGPYQVAWATIDGYMRTHHPQTEVQTSNTDRGITWSNIFGYFASHPVSVKVNADAANVSGAWSEIQAYFNSHPITVRVNTVAGSTANAPTTGPRSVTPQGQAARPESTAMTAMGLTTLSDGTLAALPTPVTAGRSAPSSTPPVINLSVNMPVGVNETKVVDLLKRYAKQNGQRMPGVPRR